MTESKKTIADRRKQKIFLVCLINFFRFEKLVLLVWATNYWINIDSYNSPKKFEWRTHALGQNQSLIEHTNLKGRLFLQKQ